VHLAKSASHEAALRLPSAAIAAAAAAGFSERDLIVVAEIGTEGPLHRMFGTRVGDFQVVLVGKDGRSTLRWSKPVSSEVPSSVIHKMPMRRDEMRQQHKVAPSFDRVTSERNVE
jgi:hypothetical protein